MSSLVREDFDLLSAEKVPKGLLFLMRCILNRKPSGLTFDHGIKRKKTQELRDLSPQKSILQIPYPKPQAWVYRLYAFPLKKLDVRAVLMGTGLQICLEVKCQRREAF